MMNKTPPRALAAACIAAAALPSFSPAAPAAPAPAAAGGGAPAGTLPCGLWYAKPADIKSYTWGWERYSLPIGNGAVGGNVFGGVARERVTLNEKTVWTGGPGERRPGYDGGNIRANGMDGKTLREVQRLFLSGDKQKIRAARDLCGKKLVGAKRPAGLGCYSLFGDLYLDFGHEKAEGYRRGLDLMTGIASVGYTAGGTRFKREYFASFPDGVLVIHLTADGPLPLDFGISLIPADEPPPPHPASYQGDDARRSVLTECSDGALAVSGKMDDNGMLYNGRLAVRISGPGSCRKDGDALRISGARDATLLIAMGTDYKNAHPKYRSGETPAALAARVRAVLEAAARRPYPDLRKRHADDFSAMMRRVRLDIGQTLPDKPTDALLGAYAKGSLPRGEQSYLEALLYQFGRYLLLSSSRGKALPANLQGLWCGKNYNKFCSDYHINVNLQMNYWPAYSANLCECALPLIDYVDSLRIPGRITAQAYFGVASTPERPANGFTAHTWNNPFGWTAPGAGFDWGWAPGAAAWLMQNVYDHYEYTGDKTMLRDRIYPMMKELASFYMQILVKDRAGRYIVCPAYSPEHGPRCESNTYEQTLAWQLFHDVIEAGEALGEEKALLARWRSFFDNLRFPAEIGASGQIKEWYEETALGSIYKGSGGHRHISHMLGLFPGDLISDARPDLFRAARVSMEDRVDRSTGWAMGQRINCWARLRDGAHAHLLVQTLLKSGILPNLWDNHPPFQIDGNFGYTSGVGEMLLQSNQGAVDILPALPPAWPDGSADGIVARGNFVVGIDWRAGRPVEIRALSRNGGPAVFRLPDSRAYAASGPGGAPVKAEATKAGGRNLLSFATLPGARYVIRPAP